jgi:hypothetical protein
MRRDTKRTNMAIKLRLLNAVSVFGKTQIWRRPAKVHYKRHHARRDERLHSVIHLNVVNELFYHSTPFVDIHIPTRQDNAPLYEIKDPHVVVEYANGDIAFA